jgi:hypothetical protein
MIELPHQEKVILIPFEWSWLVVVLGGGWWGDRPRMRVAEGLVSFEGDTPRLSAGSRLVLAALIAFSFLPGQSNR